jgi:hypothetical protein
MQQVTERDSARQNRSSRWNVKSLAIVFGALGFLAVFAVCVQLFARYQYVVENGVVWRIDRLTQQACRITYGRVNCAAPASRSTSTSTSLSTSPSVKLGVGLRHAGKKT